MEIVAEVGAENAFIFGMSSDQIINYENNGGYDPDMIYNTDPEIRQVLMQLINGTFSSDTELFRDIYDSLLSTKNSSRPGRSISFLVISAPMQRHRRRWKQLIVMRRSGRRWHF